MDAEVEHFHPFSSPELRMEERVENEWIARKGGNGSTFLNDVIRLELTSFRMMVMT